MEREKFKELQAKLSKIQNTTQQPNKNLDETINMMTSNLQESIYLSLQEKLKTVDDKFDELTTHQTETNDYITDVHDILSQFIDSCGKKIEDIEEQIHHNVDLQRMNNRLLEEQQTKNNAMHNLYNEKFDEMNKKLTVISAQKKETIMMKDIDLKKIRSQSIMKR
jgi:hypothetical protein